MVNVWDEEREDFFDVPEIAELTLRLGQDERGYWIETLNGLGGMNYLGPIEDFDQAVEQGTELMRGLLANAPRAQRIVDRAGQYVEDGDMDVDNWKLDDNEEEQ